MKNILSTIPFAALLLACGTDVPADAVSTGRDAATWPCYDGTAIPCNIAPLNFEITDEADGYVARLHAGSDELTLSGPFIDIPVGDWHALLQRHKGDSLHIDIYERKDGQWGRMNPMALYITPDTIDPYLVYRLIEPSYVSFEQLTINERNLTNFDTRVIYDNMANSRGDDGQCVNCHSFQAYNRTGRMQMHFRLAHGGTLVMQGHDIRKVNMKSGTAISSGVYPSWHPSLPLIAYSLNTTGQNFNTRDRQKVEVLDEASDVILYDVERGTTAYVAHDPDELETFPYWSPDGRSLYYCTAHFEYQTEQPDRELASRYKEIKYSIVRRPFDPSTRQFGQADTVVSAAATGQSATLPRPSPDGRYLLFTMAPYGNFHIWHPLADLYLKDLRSGEVRPLTEVNSPDVESYHAWSSSGRWIVVSSRRDDGSYTRPYFAWFDHEGRAHKPFLLPQRRQGYYQQLYKSFNIPEFIVAPVCQGRAEMVRALRQDATVVRLEE